LPFQPLLAFVMLAVRAVAVTAGVRHHGTMIASGAGNLHLGTGLAAAMFHGRECPQVVGRKAVSVLRAKVSAEGVDEVSESRHLTCPQLRQKPSIRPLIRSMA